MKGGGVMVRKGTGRVHTAGADATHFPIPGAESWWRKPCSKG